MKGLFITIDGVDGSGKTTQANILADDIRNRIDGENVPFTGVIQTREPGDTPLGAELRYLLLSGEHTPVPEAELFMFLADRSQHVREVIIPALKSGACVICDRYTDSTRAYQKAARGITSPGFEDMLKVAECGIQPDVRLWLNLPTDLAIERLESRSKTEESNRLDNETRAFHEAVNKAYGEQYALEYHNRYRTLHAVNASKPAHEMARDIASVIDIAIMNLQHGNEPGMTIC